ncbi:hypothetical protein TYRP_015808 [Tyrophagus putrescentiae]|nr:hypothetical protein TYRP_015808 [Tyrophagus putrescentiae]
MLKVMAQSIGLFFIFKIINAIIGFQYDLFQVLQLSITVVLHHLPSASDHSTQLNEINTYLNTLHLTHTTFHTSSINQIIPLLGGT